MAGVSWCTVRHMRKDLQYWVFALAAFTFAAAQTAIAENCLTTLPATPAFTPPQQYAERGVPGSFWYGSNDLWTQLPANGLWRGLNNDGNYLTKLIFWRDGYDWRKESNPQLVVTARRLDGSAPAVAVTNARSIFVTQGRPAMMVAIGIPGAGCWQITAFYGGTALDFVVAVQP